MTKIFITRTWVEFPTTEYGGMLVFCSESKETLKAWLLSELEKDEYTDEALRLGFGAYDKEFHKNIDSVIEEALSYETNDPALVGTNQLLTSFTT